VTFVLTARNGSGALSGQSQPLPKGQYRLYMLMVSDDGGVAAAAPNGHGSYNFGTLCAAQGT